MSYIIIALGFVIVACLGYICYLKFFKKYTRERFAFAGLAVISGMAMTLLLQIYSSEGFVSAFVQTSNGVLNAGFATHQTDWRDHALTGLILIILGRYIYLMFKNWNGPVSFEMYERRRFNQPSSMLQEAKLQLRYFVLHQKIYNYIPNTQWEGQHVFTNTDQEKKPWHVNVYELLSFSTDQYKIDLKTDYYDKEHCFISAYGKNEQNVIAILCCKTYPKDSAIRDFIAFVHKHTKEVYEYVIAVKELSGAEKKISWQGYELVVKNEEEMLDNLVDFSSYKDLINKRFTEDPITEGGKHTLSDIYVPANGFFISDDKNLEYERIPNEKFVEQKRVELKSLLQVDRIIFKSTLNLSRYSVRELEAYILNWTEEQSENKHLAILGEYGYGKSVLSLKVTYELLKKVKDGGRIPILIELRGKSPRTLNVNEILATWAMEYHINAASLMKLHQAGKLVILFEGFDEMDMVGDREMRLEHFQRLWQFATPHSKIIITGRPNFFLDDQEMKINLGIEKPSENSHYCQALYLEKFNKKQIELAMRNIDSTTRSQVLEILNKPASKNFYDLVSRPAILYLVAVIWKDRKLSEMKDKINSALIISEFISYSYSRQAGKQTSFPLSEKEREYFMIGIAVFMQTKFSYTNQIGKADLEHVILKLYQNLPEEIGSNTSAIQVKRKPLKARLKDNPKAEETIMTDVRSCGILVNDLTRRDYFKFAHKSFLEYQVSAYFVESLLQEKGQELIIMNAITKALDLSVNTFEHSTETIAFTSEILISKLNVTTEDTPVATAKRLFRILYPVKPFQYIPKVVPFLEFFASYSLFLLVCIVTISVLIFKIPFYNSWGFPEIAAFLTQFLLFWYTMKSKSLGVYKRNRIWIRACIQLKIKPEELYKIMPKIYIDYLMLNTNIPFFIHLVDVVFNQLKPKNKKESHNLDVTISQIKNMNIKVNENVVTENKDL